MNRPIADGQQTANRTVTGGPIPEEEKLQMDAPKTDEIAAPPTEQEEREERKVSPLRQAAAMIPVGQSGAVPQNFAQQIDYAQYMARAVSSLPKHLRNSVGDCLAIIDLASRANLSPYMFANKTYVQNDRLCFESQLFHAMLVQSGKLKGDLRVRYDGEGDDMTCTVWGTLQGEDEPHYYTSPPLKDLFPGFVEKDGKKYVKGSPLWLKKPRVQMFYDASRDWTRMFCPTATLGMYTPDELIETPIGPERAIDVSPGLSERLRAAPRLREGHADGHAERELAKIAPAGKGRQEITPADKKVSRETISGMAEEVATDSGKAAADTPPAEKKGVKFIIKADASVAKAPPTTWQQYEKEWLAKIKDAADPDLIKVWKSERPIRERLTMPIEAIDALREKIDAIADKLKQPKGRN